MIKELKLVSSICPSNNHYLSYRVVKSGNRNIVSPYPTEETKKFKKEFISYIKDEVVKQGWEMDCTGLQHYYMDWDVYFPRIDMDAANYDKVIADSITESGVVWIDDNTLCNRINHIYYDSKNPRIELTIYPVDYIGIFNTQKQLDEFEQKCKTCYRYKRNCALIKNAKIGRIQEEIDELVCSKYKKAKK